MSGNNTIQCFAMQGIMTGDDIVNIFEGHLFEGKVYWFEKGQVIPASKTYRIVLHEYQLLFSASTNIVKILDDSPDIPRFKFNLIKLKHIGRYPHQDLQLIGNLFFYYLYEFFLCL